MRNLFVVFLIASVLIFSSARAESVVYFQENFDTIPTGQLPWSGTQGQGTPGLTNCNFTSMLCASNGPPSSVQVINGEGRNGTNAARFNYHPGGTLDGLLSKQGTTTGYSEVYIRAYIKMQPNFPWGSCSDLKLFRWYIGGTSVIPGFSTNTPPWDGKHHLRVFYGTQSNSSWAAEDHNAGDWHYHEVHIRLNTPGVSDGILEYWIDGVRIINNTTFAPRASGNTSLIWSTSDAFSIGGNMPGGPSSVASVWYDDIVVADSYIGPTTGGGSSTKLPNETQIIGVDPLR